MFCVCVLHTPWSCHRTILTLILRKRLKTSWHHSVRNMWIYTSVRYSYTYTYISFFKPLRTLIWMEIFLFYQNNSEKLTQQQNHQEMITMVTLTTWEMSLHKKYLSEMPTLCDSPVSVDTSLAWHPAWVSALVPGVCRWGWGLRLGAPRPSACSPWTDWGPRCSSEGRGGRVGTGCWRRDVPEGWDSLAGGRRFRVLVGGRGSARLD